MTDAARTLDLRSALEVVVPSLDAHLEAPATGTSFGPDAAWRALLDTPVPQTGAGDETLRVLAETVVPDALRMTGSGFLGWITTGSTVVPAVARLVATLAGTQRYLGHSTGLLESVALRWLAETCSLPADMAGVFSSSGSVAPTERAIASASRRSAGVRIHCMKAVRPAGLSVVCCQSIQRSASNRDGRASG